MIEIMIGCVFLAAIVYIIAKVKDCGSNPEYDAWITQDKAKYPELYDE
jgi:hypothetical protein